jgi:UDP-N-acetylglucosamine 4,6-dehydratase
MVTGGTGSFGKTVITSLLERGMFQEIIVFSRDEKKQHEMRLQFNDPRLRFIIGDVRDRDSVFSAMRGVNYVFHAAALKNVPVCEFFPFEAVKTNVFGANNVLDAAEFNGVTKVVVLSTDKAVYPLNAMGLTKALMEKLVVARSKDDRNKTICCAVRYGNVMYSRGSVIPLFVKQIKEGNPLTITQREMTRFLLPLPHASELVLYALQNGDMGDLFVRKSPASTTQTLAEACLKIFEAKNPIQDIGIREGEKIHETLINFEESLAAEDLGDYFRVKSERSTDYDKFFSQGRKVSFSSEGYTSANTKRLDLNETVELLLTLKEIKEVLATGRTVEV